MTVSFAKISSPVIPSPRSESGHPARAVGDALASAFQRSRPEGLPAPNVAGDGTDPLAAAEAIAKAFAGSDNLDVSSFRDDSTGRYVTRITDRWSGRILTQTPPEELLRFLASAPEGAPPPTVIDA